MPFFFFAGEVGVKPGDLLIILILSFVLGQNTQTYLDIYTYIKVLCLSLGITFNTS